MTHSSLDNQLAMNRQNRAISTLAVPQDNFQPLLSNGSDYLSGRVSIRKSPFYQKQKTKLQRSQARQNAILSQSPQSRNDRSLSKMVYKGSGILFNK
jgi:hypothetical protein